MELNDTEKEYEAVFRKSMEHAEQVKEAFALLGFDKGDLKTIHFEVNTEYEQYQDKRNNSWKHRFVGYKAEHVLKIEFARDRNILGKVLYVVAALPSDLNSVCIIIKNLTIEVHNSTPAKTVGIITPYKAQAALLRRIIVQSENIKVDTVDGFQGKECDVIIFSVTRTVGGTMFLEDPRRLNVALSRARDSIIVVGDAEYAKNSRILSKVMEHCIVKQK